jgi:hypothetical protein
MDGRTISVETKVYITSNREVESLHHYETVNYAVSDWLILPHSFFYDSPALFLSLQIGCFQH